jgi:Protein of unknown function (DUF2877)
VVIQLAARSASRLVWALLFQSNPGLEIGKVLATFERACYLELADSSLAALVLPDVGDGPLNVVTEGDPGVFAAAAPGTPVHLAGKRLRVGELEIDLQDLRLWEPSPDWQTLRAHTADITRCLPLMASLALASAPEDSLLLLLSEPAAPLSDGSVRSAALARAWQAAQSLRAGWSNSWPADSRVGPGADSCLAKLTSGASQLAGLGGGLTPAGDDFLSGAMLWAWLAHPAPHDYCDALLSASITGTTTLSAAFLRAAARGECSARWHDLLRELAGESDSELAQAVQGVVALGHTSGADALAGFLWTECSQGC